MSDGRLSPVYYVECLGVDGAFQTTATLAREMKLRGHDVVFLGEGGPLEDVLAEASIPHIPAWRIMSIQTRDLHVIILAAGCSRRLAPLTQDKPKSFR